MDVSRRNLETLIKAVSFVEQQDLQKKQQLRKRGHSEPCHDTSSESSSFTSSSFGTFGTTQHNKVAKTSSSGGRSPVLVHLMNNQNNNIPTIQVKTENCNGILSSSSSTNRIRTDSLSCSLSPPVISLVSTSALSPTGSITGNGTSGNGVNTNGTSSLSTTNRHQSQLGIQNSFDLINPLMIDEGSGEMKRKQPPLVFRAGTREVHNKLEKYRRAQLKECFDALKKTLPNAAYDRKASNLNILHCACKTIVGLKKQEEDSVHELEQLSREKGLLQQRLVNLKKEITSKHNVDISELMPDLQFTEQVNIIKEEPADRIAETISIINNSIKRAAGGGLGGGGGAVENGVGTLVTMATTTTNLVNNTTTISNNNPTATSVLKLPKSITAALPVINGIKEETNNQTTTTALSVLPVSYQVNPGLVFQKLLVSSNGAAPTAGSAGVAVQPAVTHFIATAAAAASTTAPNHHHHHHNHHHQRHDGKTTMVPLLNAAQYVVKPLVVSVSTPSRPS